MLRRFLSSIPGYTQWRFQKLGGSPEYWERRYRANGNSGDGSYGRLAEFKAKVLSDFVAGNNIQSVVEFGSGDGNQLSLIPYPQYLGLDVSPTAISTCLERFREDPTKNFRLYNPGSWSTKAVQADLALSLDVLYHLVEDEIYHLHLHHLFAASQRFVIVYASDQDEPSSVPHVRPRKFTGDVQRIFPDFHLDSVIDPPWKTDFAHYGADRTPASFYIFVRDS